MNILAIVMLAFSMGDLGWSLINAKIRREFPDVKRMSTEELAGKIDNHKHAASPPVLLDVRTKAEFDVSHLQNAQRVEPDAAAATIDLPKDRAIVTYCSVGYRSGAFAQKLIKAGYPNVTNLEGSIFKWANENRPIFRDCKPATKVHPYNGVWGKLLDPARRANVP